MDLVMSAHCENEKKNMGVIVVVMALLSAAALIVSVFAIFGETSLMLPGSNGANPHLGILEQANEKEVTTGILDPDTEVRGVWIATVNNINFPSKKGLGAQALQRELDAIIDTCVKNGLNTVYFQVRPQADALYASDIFPVSEYLSGKQGKAADAGFDPLEYLVNKGHMAGLRIHAWVNPLRVTYGSKSAPAHDVSALAENHPARLNPEYTVAYGDGKLYFNAGIPEVRKLVVDGVREIARGYDVDGIVFDDYFYPYASYTNNKRDIFDDADSFDKYGENMTLDDWRRDNINKLIKACYEGVKEEDGEMLFGISPFGIWQNDDGKNGGSATKGTQSYSELYCDSLAWIEGGYIDYIAPQLYWQFTNTSAAYDTLVRWWNSVCDSTGVDLLISHGAYKYAEGWSSEDNEILKQIEFARSEISYRGSILYGYEVISKNTGNICDELALAFEDDIVYTKLEGENIGVSFNSPQNGSTLPNLDKTYVLGASDPAYPVYYNGRKLSRTKRGYFSVMLELQKGKNEFTFTQNGNDYIYTLYNGTQQSTASSSKLPSVNLMQEYTVIPVTPKNDVLVSSGEALSVTVKAPAGSEVVCTLGENSIRLLPVSSNTGKGDAFYEMTYSGRIVMPEVSDRMVIDEGELTVVARMGENKAQCALASVRVGGKDAVIPIEVTSARTGLKIATDSYYYDDFTSQAQGMRDNAVALYDGYYLLRVGGYVSQNDVCELEEEVPIAKIGKAEITDAGDHTEIVIDSDVNIPMNGRVENGYFILNLYNVDISLAKAPEMSENPLFEKAEYQVSTKKNCFRYHLKLKDPDNFFGFEFAYENGKPVVRLKNPSAPALGEYPLDKKMIVLDAGHGGSDMGASGGAIEYSEAQINLSIVLSARQKLEKLGATVVLTREDDSYVALTDRIKFVEELSPDLLISVHQNSMEYNVDITRVYGTMALYWEHAGSLLSKVMSESVSTALGRVHRGASRQKLGMVRCERYPSTLIELGFMTCVEEYEKTSSQYGIEKAAQAIADGVVEYYNRQVQ